ncbi:MAG: hypothetical protein KC776_34710 [Myxococcales bacterium]|nr:hypothetical protein [Myxococcales bacterium]MCB9581906.1 peptidase-C39 like family protein [Polyangiaceae bacterium]
MPKKKLRLEILPQPDDTTCGPTCLHAVYRYYGEDLPLDKVIRETQTLREGGTLGVQLANHALSRGYRVTLYTYNLLVFDPTWFEKPGVDLADRLRRQAEVKRSPKLRQATRAYLEFLQKGGKIRFEDLTASLIRRYLGREIPILTGLSATYLYRSARELGEHVIELDDIRGEPMGHFVVLNGYNREERLAHVSDPWEPESRGRSRQYWIDIDRVMNAILLGIVTYDANLLIIEPSDARAHRRQ